MMIPLPVFQPFLLAGAASLVFMILVFLISLIKHDNSVADSAWGIGFIVIGILTAIHQPFSFKILMIMSMIVCWGLRLAIHVTSRNRGRTEDFRYKQWREQWGRQVFLRSFFQVYLLQWFFMQCIAITIVIAISYAQPNISFVDWIGFFVWLIGFIFETVGDTQLTKFKNNPVNKGHVMQTGLWRYSRHPNYFGEVTQWWGVFFFTMATSFWYVALISPLTITILILKVSGIPLLEKKYAGNEEFELYKQKTSVFIPWFPKRS